MVRLGAHFQYAGLKKKQKKTVAQGEKKAKIISHTVLDYSTTEWNFGGLRRGLGGMHVNHQA